MKNNKLINGEGILTINGIIPLENGEPEEIILNSDQKLTIRALIRLINLTINIPEFNREQIIKKRFGKWCQHTIFLILLIGLKLSLLRNIPSSNQHLFIVGIFVSSLLIPIKLIMCSWCLLSHFRRNKGKLTFLRKSKITNRRVIYCTLITKILCIKPKLYVQPGVDEIRGHTLQGLKWHLLHHLLCPLENLPYCLILLLM